MEDLLHQIVQNLHHPTQQIFGFFTLALPIGVKVISAIICGGLIGLEREIKNKPAGIKTNILICLGSVLYTVVSILVSQSFVDSGYHGDPARIAAQIVPGIGFLGAGAIMQSRLSIHGLTTAATIWIVAAIGLCIGSGYIIVGFAFTLTVLFTLLAINKLEHEFIGRSGAHAVEIVFKDDSGKTREEISRVMRDNGIGLDDFDILKSDDKMTLVLTYNNSSIVHKKFILDLWSISGIREVRQL